MGTNTPKSEIAVRQGAIEAGVSQKKIVPEQTDLMLDRIFAKEPALLTERQKARVQDIAAEIDLSDPNGILAYGAALQSEMAESSRNAFQMIQSVDTIATGEVLSALAKEINDFDLGTIYNNKIFRFFTGKKYRLKKIISAYRKLETRLDDLILELEKRKIQTMKNVELYNILCEECCSHISSLSLYIIAGERKITDLLECEIPRLKEIADEKGTPTDIFALRDMSSACGDLENRIKDLSLSRNIAFQMSAQFRLLQNSEKGLAEKIQSAIVNTIPVWRSQVIPVIEIAFAVLKEKEPGASDTTYAARLRNSNAPVIAFLEEALRLYGEGERLRGETTRPTAQMPCTIRVAYPPASHRISD